MPPHDFDRPPRPMQFPPLGDRPPRSQSGESSPAQPPPPRQALPTSSERTKQQKSAIVAAVGIGVFVVLVPAGYFNLWTFGGIDFPDAQFADWYQRVGWISVYGTAAFMPILAILLIAARNIRLRVAVTLTLIPLVLQVIAFVLFNVLGERYGYICC